MSCAMLNSLLLSGERPCSKTHSKQSGKLHKLWSHQKSLDLFRKIATLPVFVEIGDTDPLKYVDTRYGRRGNGGMTEETETRYPTEVQQSLQCYPDSDRVLEEPGSVLSDLRASVVSFVCQ